MKFFLILLLFSCCFSISKAQTQNKSKSIYFLVSSPTNKIVNDMWKIEYDDPISYYILQCPCLANNQQPIFSYNNTDKPVLISKTQFKELTITNLPNLILKAKKIIESNLKSDYDFFIVEPHNRIYKIKKVKIGQTHLVY
jgi:hypothetical protein